ncbi:hypothetical protein SAMN05192575_10422 [Nocardioides alpinus]|uniref:Lipoprotein LpqN n=1 Tax=Nocardioides alpinus TaxID=748909 RepID=A0A1I0YJ41_9ACTN|nr:hypothetical protein [Nocardioides alpinus]PKH43560.1 hypothetical protein CXG46_03660 [Nocardioides alpinus]SFB13455.1 hypothetical protein SAMN05192575_10422 [Nocardioides alpinus]
MISRGNRRCWPVVASAAAIVLLAAGCGESGDPDPSGEPTASASTTESASPTPTTAATPTTAVVEPADGGLVKVPGASMRALASYKHLNDYGIVQGWNDGQSSLSFAPSLTPATSLDAFAREWIKEHGGKGVKVRQEDAVAGGKYRAWHVIDTTTDPSEIKHDFGIMFLDSAWLIDITIYLDGVPRTLTDEEQQQVIDSLLATFKTDLD